MPVLTATDLHKAFGPQKILDGVTVTLRSAERVGLVGINGSGKSTLARILAGVEPPDHGSIARRRGAEIAYLAQDPVFDGALTPRDVVMAGLAAWTEAKERHDRASRALGKGEGDLGALLDEQAKATAEVERLGGWDRMHEVDSILGHVGVTRLDARMDTLSGGDRRRVALARILVSRPALAVLDEPSNHLDVETVEWLERYLIDVFPGALLLITHDRYLLDRVATRTLELDQGKLYDYDGGYEEYLEAKEERLALEARTESNRQNFLRTELEWLRRQPKARTGKQKARIQRAEAQKAAPPPKVERTTMLSIEGARTGKTILELHDLGLSVAGRPLVSGLSFILTPGERVGIVGRNGTGKTTLLRAILGEIAPDEGQIVVGKNTKIAYFDQHRADLDDAASIFDNVADNNSRITVGGQTIEVRAYLERFLFDPHKQRQPVGSLSGGERARVALAKMLSRGANLVILDEPTNDLDVATLSALETLLTELDGCALCVTHDRWFLNRVATSILAFEGDGKVVRYAGAYDAYREQKARIEEAKAAAAAEKEAPAREPAREPAKDKGAAPKGKGLTYAERIELDGIMGAIEKAEGEVAVLLAKLADPSLYAARGGEVPGLRAALEQAQAEAARLLARWEDLETRKAAGPKG
ncbi:MAG: ABC-F family ATP-binding cassette domain-containing protein [Byssovorax sp.]